MLSLLLETKVFFSTDIASTKQALTAGTGVVVADESLNQHGRGLYKNARAYCCNFGSFAAEKSRVSTDVASTKLHAPTTAVSCRRRVSRQHGRGLYKTHALIAATAAVVVVADESLDQHGRGQPWVGYPRGGPGDQLRRAKSCHGLCPPGGTDSSRWPQGARRVPSVTGEKIISDAHT